VVPGLPGWFSGRMGTHTLKITAVPLKIREIL
jgi:hypothetical protein